MKVTIMNSCTVLLTFIVICIAAQGDLLDFSKKLNFDMGMSNFGSFINNHVQQQVRQLTSQMNRQVLDINRDLQRQIHDLGSDMQMHMSSISENVNSQVNNLGYKIRQQVQQSLQPVNAMITMSAMAQGIGGTTVATYGDKLTLMIKNSVKYYCSGEIIADRKSGTIRCSTKLTTTLSSEDQLCTESSYSRVNNIYCFGNYATFQCISDSCYCNGGKMYTLNTLKGICGENYGTNEYVKYDYYPDASDSNHIPIPNPNNHVKCINKPQDGHCAWYSSGFVIAVKDV